MNPIQVKLLIVDDSASMRAVVRQLMTDLGIIAIDEAADGRAALALFRGKSYDLVITDWEMPHMSGIDFLRAIRRSGNKETPVLLLSGNATAKHTMEALLAGANGFLEKPFETGRLCDKVRRIVAALPTPSSKRHAARVRHVELSSI